MIHANIHHNSPYVQRLPWYVRAISAATREWLCATCLLFGFPQNVMTSQVLRSHLEATFITVESASYYGVKAEPSRVLVNAQDAAFTYRANQVRPS